MVGSNQEWQYMYSTHTVRGTTTYVHILPGGQGESESMCAVRLVSELL